MEEMELEVMRDEFNAVLVLILDLLEHGETERAIAALKEILKK